MAGAMLCCGAVLFCPERGDKRRYIFADFRETDTINFVSNIFLPLYHCIPLSYNIIVFILILKSTDKCVRKVILLTEAPHELDYVKLEDIYQVILLKQV